MLNFNNKRAIRKLSIRSLRNSKTRNIIAVVAIILTAVLFVDAGTFLLPRLSPIAMRSALCHDEYNEK